jgi:hypothetical protein
MPTPEPAAFFAMPIAEHPDMNDIAELAELNRERD